MKILGGMQDLPASAQGRNIWRKLIRVIDNADEKK